jgi:glycosyltransferase involved in cell wall biosynthesis
VEAIVPDRMALAADALAGNAVHTTLTPEDLEARVLAIPLFESKGSLAGLTSLVDAMALGKPVIMTRNPYIDLDIEACGIGKWVDPGDVDGWADAIDWFDRHPDESHEMGRRARALVDEQGYNSASFALRIHRLIETAGAS